MPALPVRRVFDENQQRARRRVALAEKGGAEVDSDACEKLRAARIEADLSLRELGRRVGISASMLSQIENGRAQPSVATLYALVSCLNLSLDELLGGTTGRRDRLRVPVVGPAERAILVMDSGVTWERLTAESDPLVDALMVTYPPGSRSSSGGGLMSHSGREYGFLLSGRLTVQLGFETFTLEAGSSVSFDSAIPHAYVNDYAEAAQGVWHVVGRNASESSAAEIAPQRAAAPGRSAAGGP
jgi:transcriptional regulator with XRE-family HTH domain